MSIEPGTTIHVRYIPDDDATPEADPIPWLYWATYDGSGNEIPETSGWAGTSTEAVEFCIEKIGTRP